MAVKILMLEAVPTDADLISRQLLKDELEFEAKRVDDKKRFLDALHSFKPNVILSDYILPQFSAIDALEVKKKIAPYIPFILVTDHIFKKYKEPLIQLGANNYILKNNLTCLAPAIKSSLEKAKLKTKYYAVKSLNEKIKNKNTELRNISRKKDHFLCILSHDLQNHVSSLMLTLSLICKDNANLTEKQQNYIKRLHRSAAGINQILNDCSLCNHIHHGAMQPVYSLINFGNVVKKVLEKYENNAICKNIKLNYHDKCKDAFFRTDMSYVSMITDNLISNAIKFSPIGNQVDIKINKIKNKYTLEVKDYGPGIPSDDVPKLYGCFQKLTPKPTADEYSTGLGLSIVKGLVDALQANIECETEVGKGTTFKVSF